MNINLSEIVDKIVSDAGVPYLEVVCHKEGKCVYKENFGENKSGNIYFQMYSCSKPITVFAAMLLVDRGLVSLDDEVEKYLPEMKDCFVLDADGNKRAPKVKMQIYHLMTMTAGFDYNLSRQPVVDLVKENPNASLRDFVKVFVKSPLLFDPGERFQYGISHDILAAVIEAASGKRFSEFVSENIFKPLSMNDSFFDNREVPLVEMYTYDQDGSIVLRGNENRLILTPNYECGGAGLVCSIDDYASFARMLASGGFTPDGKRLIGKEAFDLMIEEQFEKAYDKKRFNCAQGVDYGYGLGVRVRKNATEWGLPIGEFGWDGAAGSYIMADPVNNISVVVGMNVLGWPSHLRGFHLDIVKAVYESIVK